MEETKGENDGGMKDENGGGKRKVRIMEAQRKVRMIV